MPYQLYFSTILWCGVAQAYEVLAACTALLAPGCLPAFEQSCLHGADAQMISAWNLLRDNNCRNDCAALDWSWLCRR